MLIDLKINFTFHSAEPLCKWTRNRPKSHFWYFKLIKSCGSIHGNCVKTKVTKIPDLFQNNSLGTKEELLDELMDVFTTRHQRKLEVNLWENNLSLEFQRKWKPDFEEPHATSQRVNVETYSPH